MKALALFIVSLIVVATALPVANPGPKYISYNALAKDLPKDGVGNPGQANPPNRGCEAIFRCRS